MNLFNTHQTPLENSYWIIPDKLLAGEYPRTKDVSTSRYRLETMFRAGITRFSDLTTHNDNLADYEELLRDVSGGRAKRLNFPIPDVSIPNNPNQMLAILDAIDIALWKDMVCIFIAGGGVGRTVTVVGCWLKRHLDGIICQAYLTGSKTLNDLWKEYPKSLKKNRSPETKEQQAYIDNWQEPNQDSLPQDHRF